LKSKERLDAIRHVVATIFSAQNALRALAPELRWRGMGNLLGDYGELIARERYGLLEAPPGSDGYDARTKDKRTVQVKTNYASSTIGFRGKADLMLVIKVNSDGSWDQVYYGDFAKVQAPAGFSKRDNKRVITISKLRKLALGTGDS